MGHRPTSCELCVRTAIKMGIDPATLDSEICGQKYPSDPWAKGQQAGTWTGR